jgi:hypothetical protein
VTRELIEAALAGVAVTVCRRCHGWGIVGLPSLSSGCPDCGGRGLTTTNELEMSDDAHPNAG